MSPEFNQESLFVIAKQSGQLATRNVNEQPDVLAVPLIEHYIHLQNTISALAELSLARGFISSAEPSERSYGEEVASTVRDSVTHKIPGIVASAESEFAKAAGSDLMIEMGEDETKVKRLQREMYSKFLIKYRFPKNAQAAVAYRNDLVKRVNFLKVAPERKVDIPQILKSTDTEAPNSDSYFVPDKMPETHDRIRAIYEDNRAGFLPYTHLEKNTVLTYLDYIDSPEYVRGVSNQLLEVFHHQQKKYGSGMKEGRRAIESIVYEVGDFLTNARNSAQYLGELKELIEECPAPHAKIIDEAGNDHSGYLPLVRYIDSMEFLKKGVTKGLLADQHQTKEYRWAKGNEPGKHKIIEDQYTRDDPDELFKERVKTTIESLTIKQLRKIIEGACSNEDARVKFYEARLIDFKRLPESKNFDPIIKTIEELLQGSYVTVVTTES